MSPAPSATGATAVLVLYGPASELLGIAAYARAHLGVTPDDQGPWWYELDAPDHALQHGILKLVGNADPERDALEALPALMEHAQHLWISLPEAMRTQVWGHSLLLQADLEGAAVGQAVADALQARLQPHGLPHHVLACHPSDLGSVRLYGLPDGTEPGGRDRATYLALGAADRAGELVYELLGRDGLLGVDLQSHRAFHQVREARREGRRHHYMAALDEMREGTDRLLQLPSGRSRRRFLGQLVELRDTLSQAQVELDAVRHSLLRQIHDLRAADRRAIDLGAVLALHRDVLDTAATDVTLLVEEADRPLAAARSAIQSVQALQNEVTEQRSWWLGIWISVVVTGLTVATVVDRGFWAGALRWTVDGVIPADRLVSLLGVQLFASLVAMVTIFVVLQGMIRMSVRQPSRQG